MSAKQFTTEEQNNIALTLSKFGLSYQVLGHYSSMFKVDLEGNMNMMVNTVKNYSDTTGVKDFTGIVFTVWKNGRLLKTFTGPDSFIAGYPQIELEIKRVRAGQRLSELEKDFIL